MRKRGVTGCSRVPETLVNRLLRGNRRYRLTVVRNGNEPRERKFCVYTSICAENGYGVHNACVDNLRQAILERSFFVEVDGLFVRPIRPTLGWYNGRFTDFRNIVVQEVRWKASKKTLRETVNLYHGSKYKRYLNAYESICRKPLCKRDRELQVFCKFEKVPVVKAARVINPPDARYGLYLASYLKASEHIYFDAINVAFGARTRATVLKGFDVFESANIMHEKWDLFIDPVAVGIDATKFDMHVSMAALMYEHRFYKEVFPCAILAELLRWQLLSKSVGRVNDGSVSASFEGTRCSGDINTSLGNCIIMCAILWALAQFHELNIELVNNGDDCVVFMERGDLALFMRVVTEWFENSGFRVKVETPVEIFEEVEFCQAHPVFDGDKWRMVRNPLACMTKDPMCLKAITSVKALNKWRGAVGAGGLSLASGIPVMQSFYSCMKRGTRSCTRKYFNNMICSGNGLAERGAHLGVAASDVTSAARTSFYQAFKITPSEQLAMENYYDQVVLSDELNDNTILPPVIIGMAPVIFSTTN